MRTRYISLDAANRAWMQGGDLSLGPGGRRRHGRRRRWPRWWRAVARASTPGDLVFADTGWQDYAVLPAKRLDKLPDLRARSPTCSASMGWPGSTAYFGLLECGRPRPGETVVVSAAAGSVGSLVGQIAKIKGCKGGRDRRRAEKCAWLVDELGFDAAVDYKAGEVSHAPCGPPAPEGIDVYFDNVGGEIFEACLFGMNTFGRIACCGAVSQYDGAAPAHGRAAFLA